MKITAIKQQVKRTDRCSVFVDGKFAFGLSETGLLESGLASGQEINNRQMSELKKTAGLDRAYSNALRYAAMRPHSEWEMAAYLKRKGVDEPAAKQIIERLRRIGLLDDLAFARAWVQNRRQLKNVSRRRLSLELKQKYVAEDIIEKVLSADTGSDQVALRRLIAKKCARYTDKQKLMRYLARQGFSYDDIKLELHDQ